MELITFGYCDTPADVADATALLQTAPSQQTIYIFNDDGIHKLKTEQTDGIHQLKTDDCDDALKTDRDEGNYIPTVDRFAYQPKIGDVVIAARVAVEENELTSEQLWQEACELAAQLEDESTTKVKDRMVELLLKNSVLQYQDVDDEDLSLKDEEAATDTTAASANDRSGPATRGIKLLL